MSELTPKPDEKDNDTKRFTSVKDIGLTADRNGRYRRRMEDTHSIHDGLDGVESTGFFAIFDGHSGKGTADFCAANLHNIVANELKEHKDSEITLDTMKVIMTNAFHKADDEMKKNSVMGGACAVVALVMKVNDKRWLFIANVGDSRAVLSKSGKAVRMTFDHTPDVEEEVERIKAKKGFIRNGRVNDMIAITRALGDLTMKDWIISDPHVDGKEIEEDDELLILACDGVWEVLSDQEALDLIKDEDISCTDMSKKLVQEALKRGSTDNLSVMVVRL